MARKLLLTLTIIFSPLFVWSQVGITGKVISKEDKSVLPGVNVVEKGTYNGTVTKKDGTFSIEVSSTNSMLVFSFIGMITQEVPLKGKTNLLIEAKWDCHKDFFDSQQIHIYINSGVINSPIGGQINIASPWLFGGVIKGLYSFQTDLKQNAFQNLQVELDHFISNCDFDIDFRWTNKTVSFDDRIDFNIHSNETDFNRRNLQIITGYSYLDFKRLGTDKNDISSGVLLGIGTYFNLPLYPTARIKFYIHKERILYQASIQGGYKHFNCFIRFNKLNSLLR